MQNLSDKSCTESKHTHFIINIFFFSSKNHAFYEVIWGKKLLCRTGHRWQHGACELLAGYYKSTLRICTIDCFSTATMVARTPLNVTFIRALPALLRYYFDGLLAFLRTSKAKDLPCRLSVAAVRHPVHFVHKRRLLQMQPNAIKLTKYNCSSSDETSRPTSLQLNVIGLYVFLCECCWPFHIEDPDAARTSGKCSAVRVDWRPPRTVQEKTEWAARSERHAVSMWEWAK
jgi:hypothetical protein